MRSNRTKSALLDSFSKGERRAYRLQEVIAASDAKFRLMTVGHGECRAIFEKVWALECQWWFADISMAQR
jgi:hypothetical protein